MLLPISVRIMLFTKLLVTDFCSLFLLFRQLFSLIETVRNQSWPQEIYTAVYTTTTELSHVVTTTTRTMVCWCHTINLLRLGTSVNFLTAWNYSTISSLKQMSTAADIFFPWKPWNRNRSGKANQINSVFGQIFRLKLPLWKSCLKTKKVQ